LNSQLEKIYTELDNEKKFHLETKKSNENLVSELGSVARPVRFIITKSSSQEVAVLHKFPTESNISTVFSSRNGILTS